MRLALAWPPHSPAVVPVRDHRLWLGLLRVFGGAEHQQAAHVPTNSARTLFISLTHTKLSHIEASRCHYCCHLINK